MLKNRPVKIAVSGSLAYDRIMDFPGCFTDHIISRQIQQLNLSFSLSSLRQSFGGTAGNIAYNLALLKEKPIILGIVGSDFYSYKKWLKAKKIDSSRIKVVRGATTATAHIITDKQDNQIAAFYPGPDFKNYACVASRLKNITLAIIAADDKKRMMAYAAAWRKNKVPFIFDPGQSLTTFSGKELKAALQGAEVLIGNDYEIKLVAARLKISRPQLIKKIKILVVTKGGKGSEIYQAGGKLVIKSAKPLNTCDPTGAGDAYRAGFIRGLLSGCDLKTCGQLAGLVAAYTVEKFGTQTHSFTMKELVDRYRKNFKERLVI
jgi:adenosine kinase